MANGLIDPPSNNAGLTAGNSGSGSPNSKRNLIIGGVAAVALVGLYLYAKNKSASSSGTSTAAPPEVITPANNADTAIAGLGGSLTEQQNQLLQQEQANGQSLTNSLSSALSAIQASIAGSQGAIISSISAGQSTAPATPPAQSLPPVNASLFQQLIPFGQYTSSEFTQIGTVTNGVYNGQEVGGGVPVYHSNDYGGLQQGAFPGTGSYGVYIPSSETAYLGH